MLKHSQFLIHKNYRFAHSPFTIIVLCYVCVFFQPMIWKMRFITIMRKYEKIHTWRRSFISSKRIRPGSKKLFMVLNIRVGNGFFFGNFWSRKDNQNEIGIPWYSFLCFGMSFSFNNKNFTKKLSKLGASNLSTRLGR